MISGFGYKGFFSSQGLPEVLYFLPGWAFPFALAVSTLKAKVAALLFFFLSFLGLLSEFL